MRKSIRIRLSMAFIGLAIVPLLLVGTILAWRSFTIEQQQALTLQREVARRVAIEVTAFFEELENELTFTRFDQMCQQYPEKTAVLYLGTCFSFSRLCHKGNQQSGVNIFKRITDRFGNLFFRKILFQFLQGPQGGFVIFRLMEHPNFFINAPDIKEIVISSLLLYRFRCIPGSC